MLLKFFFCYCFGVYVIQVSQIWPLKQRCMARPREGSLGVTPGPWCCLNKGAFSEMWTIETQTATLFSQPFRHSSLQVRDNDPTKTPPPTKKLQSSPFHVRAVGTRGTHQGDDCGGQLLWVPHEDQLVAAVDQWGEGFDLTSLPGLRNRAGNGGPSEWSVLLTQSWAVSPTPECPGRSEKSLTFSFCPKY